MLVIADKCITVDPLCQCFCMEFITPSSYSLTELCYVGTKTEACLDVESTYNSPCELPSFVFHKCSDIASLLSYCDKSLVSPQKLTAVILGDGLE